MTKHFTYAVGELSEQLSYYAATHGNHEEPRARWLAAKALEWMAVCNKIYSPSTMNQEDHYEIWKFRVKEVQDAIAKAEEGLAALKLKLHRIEGESV